MLVTQEIACHCHLVTSQHFSGLPWWQGRDSDGDEGWHTQTQGNMNLQCAEGRKNNCYEISFYFIKLCEKEDYEQDEEERERRCRKEEK